MIISGVQTILLIVFWAMIISRVQDGKKAIYLLEIATNSYLQIKDYIFHSQPHQWAGA